MWKQYVISSFIFQTYRIFPPCILPPSNQKPLHMNVIAAAAARAACWHPSCAARSRLTRDHHWACNTQNIFRAAEQVNSWGGRGEHAKPAPLGGSGGMLPQENFEFARSEIESGAIWRHLKPSTHIVKLSNLLVLEQRTRSRVRRCMRATVNATVRLQQ